MMRHEKRGRRAAALSLLLVLILSGLLAAGGVGCGGFIYLGPAVDDGYEENDFLTDAWDFSGGPGVWLSVYGGSYGVQADYDWYRIVVPAGEEWLVADLDFTDAFGDQALAVYDSTGALVAWVDSNDDDEVLSVILPAAGTYYLLVYGDAAGNSYNLRWLTYVPDDPYEPNNTLPQAWDFTGGEGEWLSVDGGAPGVQFDNDWYEISVAAGYEQLVAELDFVHAEGDLGLAVYDDLGGLVGFSDGTTDDETVSVVVPAAGTYYLYVYGDDAGNEYDLRWQTYVPDDGYELNNLIGEAWDFTGGEAAWLSIYGGERGLQADDDWFEIAVPSGYERLQATLDFLHAFGDLALAVYDDTGTLVTFVDSATDDEVLDVVLSSDGTYYLLVYGDDAGNDYDLIWEAVAP